MLNNSGFDLWADSYDNNVIDFYESDRYPFAGYKELMNAIYNEICSKKGAKVLDIGFGTGFLTSKLYEAGHYITGIDFSEKMIEIARGKMPKAELIKWDFSSGLPSEVKKKTYDYIICTYAIHHLDDDKKERIIEEAVDLLKENGKVIIGDVAFENRNELDNCRIENADCWDNDEIYVVSSELVSRLKPQDIHGEFVKVGYCSGIMIFSKYN